MAVRRNRRSRRRNRGRFGFLYKLLSTLVICAAILLGCVVFFPGEHRGSVRSVPAIPRRRS